ncbi:hypothetical protein [Kitasatospora cathayae]|uniref:DUF5753 domain-containing protein n=1 Tax=Kitasatospora cathayae TaxID=3004092 RepID=A0ABY7Q1H0_9ACTN|nr:hypothetical protein [Kitasatospora sp. HUAS 3-15]WBP86507.1 hypothetical protein O1G21_12090 [Kitasatospora sp. HUAS 3-15]
MGDDAAKAGGPEFKIRPGQLKDAAPTFENQSKALKEAGRHGMSTAMMDRLAAIDWTYPVGHDVRAASRSRLMAEYLRRASLWAQVLGGPPRWPYFDIAGALAPEVRVDPEVAERLEEYIEKHVEFVSAEFVCRAAVRWATLRDTPGVQLPDLPDPFEPLILMYERGGEVLYDDSWAFNFGGRAVRITPWRDHLSAEPATALDLATLDSLDHEYERADVDRQ